MDNRKYYLNGILMIIMVLIVLTASAAPALAEDAVLDSTTTVTADQNGKEKAKDEFSGKFGPDWKRRSCRYPPTVEKVRRKPAGIASKKLYSRRS